MNSKSQLELLKNKKSSIEISINNTIALILAILVMILTVAVSIRISDIVISLVVTGLFLVILLASGTVNHALRVRAEVKLVNEIDSAIYKIITKETMEKEIDEFIERLY